MNCWQAGGSFVTNTKQSHKTHIMFSYSEIVIYFTGCKGNKFMPGSNLSTCEIV